MRSLHSYVRHYSALLFVLPLFLCLAAQAATISGRVTTHAAGDYIKGALVVASDGTHRLEATTETDGSYEIVGLPAGKYKVRASYISYSDEETLVEVAEQGRSIQDFSLKAEGLIVLSPFVVEGVAEGQAKAINQQKNSDTVVSIISGDAAGALPDQTIGQALNRLAGINVVDDSEISIRGSEGKLNTISLDGVSLSSPKAAIGQDETRAVDLASIPTSMIESIEVFKVLTPDTDASSFGGTVNLKTRSAFDYKRDIYQASIEGQRGSYHANHPDQPNQYTFNVSVGKRINEKFGFLVTGMVRAGQSFGETQSLTYRSAGNSTLNRNTNISDQGLQEVDRWVTAGRSKQYAANATLDWRPTVDTKLYFKFNVGATFSESQTWRARIRDIAGFDDSSTPTYQTGSRASVPSGSGLIRTSARIMYRPSVETKHTPTMGFNFGGETKVNNLKLSYQLAETFSRARQRQRRASFDITNATVQRSYNWTIDRSDPQFPIVNITQRTTGESIFDRPQDATLEALRRWNGDKDDYRIIGRVDAELPFLWRFPTKFKVGVKVNDTRRIQENSLEDWTTGSVTINPVTGFGTETKVATPMSAFEMSAYVPRGTFNGAAATLGSQPDVDKAFQYMENNIGQFYNMIEVPKSGTPNGGNEYHYFKFNVFTLRERITAGYAMATTDFGKLRSVAGLRYEHTKQAGDWEGAASNKQAAGGSEYGNLFPSMMLTYNLSKNQKIRLAYSTAITRANLTDLLKRNSIAASNANADPELLATPGTYNIGNPNLKPQKTQNFDLSYDLYYQPTGLLSVQVFNKHITDFIYTTQKSDERDYISGMDPVTGAPVISRGTFRIQQPVNGSLQDIYGLELSLQQNLRKVNFLPQAVRGLGVQGTITFLRGKNTVYEQEGTNGPLVPVTTYYLISQPSKMYNVQVYWDYKRFTARIAYNHRDSFRRVAANRSNLLLGVKINDDIDQWSFKTTYRFTRNWQLFFSGRNIFKEPSSATYQDRPDLPLNYGYRGMSLSGGLRWDY